MAPGLPLQAVCQVATRATRHRDEKVAHGDHGERLFLARPRVPERSPSDHQRPILARENRPQPGAGHAQPGAAAGCWMERDCRVGVPVVSQEPPADAARAGPGVEPHHPGAEWCRGQALPLDRRPRRNRACRRRSPIEPLRPVSESVFFEEQSGKGTKTTK